MNEVLADVYALTGDAKYLALAQRFSHRALLDPLRRREDTLTGLHANTQIPKAIGYARIAELGGEPGADAARVLLGARSSDTARSPSAATACASTSTRRTTSASMLESREGPETCNTYNMLRLTEQLFAHRAGRRATPTTTSARSSITSCRTHHPEHGGYVYFTPIRPRHYRVYSQPITSFWCCVGTGMENHGKYGEFIYAHAATAVRQSVHRLGARLARAAAW